MNGIERLTERIGADAKAEADAIMDAARTEAEAAAAKYRAAAERESAELSARNEKDAAEREERLVSVAQMEARKTLLAARRQMVETAFDKALEKLCSLPDAQYTQVAAELLQRAAPDGKGEVIFSPKDRDRVGAEAVKSANKALNGSLLLSEETRPLRGGFVLKNGNVEVNCTFETLVRLQKGEIAGEVAKRLFPEL